MKIKICGIQNRENLQQIVALEPDYLGFIFYPKSKRYVLPHLVEEDFKSVPSSIKKIGVFVNESSSNIQGYVEKYNLDGIQFHGDETPEEVAVFKNAGLEIFKAFGLNDDFNFSQLEKYEEVVDHFLFDTQSPQYGGTGIQFNWKILENFTSQKSFLLSGGIGIEELEEVLTLSNWPIHAVDLNSRLEISPGMKDIDKVKNAIKIVRHGKV